MLVAKHYISGWHRAQLMSRYPLASEGRFAAYGFTFDGA